MEVFNKNSLVNLANSILVKYGVSPFHETISEIDKVIKNEKKIILCLFDGFGTNIRKLHLTEDSVLNKYFIHRINSTFPPTTAAATTAVLTGKFPIETGWLGWDLYFKEYDKNIILFTNGDYNSNDILQDRSQGQIAFQKFPYKTIMELIKEKNPNLSVFDIKRKPACIDGPSSLRQAKHKLNEVLKNDECFAYFYWDEPDCTMHHNGIDCKRTHKAVMKVDRFIDKISRKHPDTLFLVIADHGHVNTEYLDFEDHQDFVDTLSRYSTLERRCPSFFVKKDKEKEFETLFNKYYGNEFELMTKKHAMDINLFGEGVHAKGIEDCLGDYIAITKGKYSLYSTKEMVDFALYPGHHAGGTKEEREIDVSAIKRKR